MIDLASCRAALPLPALMARIGLGEHAKVRAKCPFHQPDNNPSFSVFQDTKDGSWLWKCHSGCGTGNDVALVQKHFALTDYGAACKRYAELAGTDSKPSIVSEAKRILGATLTSGNGSAKQTLSGDGNAAYSQGGGVTVAKAPNGVPKGENPPPAAQPLSPVAIEKLAAWRGYALPFVEEIAKQGIVQVFDGCIAFPVTGGFHYRVKNGDWYYTKGVKTELFIPGKLEEGANIMAFESPWDALAYAESMGELDNIVASRGAGNARLIAERLKGHTGALYLWGQNDIPGRKWAADIAGLLPDAQIKLPEIPGEHKDLNDWRKAGATSGAVWNAFVDAIPFPAVPVLAETERPEETLVTKSQEARESISGLTHQLETVAYGDSRGGGENTLSGGVEGHANVSANRITHTEGAAREASAPTGGLGVQNSPVSRESGNQIPPAQNLSLAATLDSIVAFLTRYVTFPLEEQAIAIALWVAHTHVFEAFRFTPYLNICSPEKRCGKTRLLECLQLLVKRPRCMNRPTEAVLFRTINKHQPTLMVDEIDTIYSKESDDRSEGMRAVFNAGFQFGPLSKIPRCIGNDHEPKDYETFCPKVLAGIGNNLPDTIIDRSLPIRLIRQLDGSGASEFFAEEAEVEAAPIVAQLEAWASSCDLHDVLRKTRPNMPGQLKDRQKEMCRPLIAIADGAGGEWPMKGREALVALSIGHEDQSEGVQLLTSCREVFSAKYKDALTTHELLDALIAIESASAPWAAWWEQDIKHGAYNRPANRLARMLDLYGIKPISMKTNDGHDGEKTVKGYHAGAFEDAFRRYLSPIKGMQTMQLDI